MHDSETKYAKPCDIQSDDVTVVLPPIANGELIETIREYFEERAAIREFDGGQTRREAEHGAYWDCRRWFGKDNLPAEFHERYLAHSKNKQRSFWE